MKSPEPDCYSIVHDSISFAGTFADKYSNKIISDKGPCLMASAYSRNWIKLVAKSKGKWIEINYNESSSMDIKNQILKTFKFID